MKKFKTTNGVDISEEIADAWNDLDILNHMIDEGYFNSDGTPKEDLETVNEFLSKQKDYYKFFKNKEEMDSFLGKIKKTLLQLTSKIK
jgi:uncharacterized protein YdaT